MPGTNTTWPDQASRTLIRQLWSDDIAEAALAERIITHLVASETLPKPHRTLLTTQLIAYEDFATSNQRILWTSDD